MQWIKLIDRMPNPDEHDRVLSTRTDRNARACVHISKS